MEDEGYCPLSFFVIILVRIITSRCLLRYYVAAGVRIYSQDSWKMLFGEEGRHKVERYIKETVNWWLISCLTREGHRSKERVFDFSFLSVSGCRWPSTSCKLRLTTMPSEKPPVPVSLSSG